MKTENEIQEIPTEKVTRLYKLRKLDGEEFINSLEELDILEVEVGLLEDILFDSVEQMSTFNKIFEHLKR